MTQRLRTRFSHSSRPTFGLWGLAVLLALSLAAAGAPGVAPQALAALDDPAKSLSLGGHITVEPGSAADVDPMRYPERFCAWQLFQGDVAGEEATTLANVEWGASVTNVGVQKLLKAVASSKLTIGEYNDQFSAADASGSVQTEAGEATTLGALFRHWLHEHFGDVFQDEVDPPTYDAEYAQVKARDFGAFLSTFGQVGTPAVKDNRDNTPYPSQSPYSASKVAAAFAAEAETVLATATQWKSEALAQGTLYDADEAQSAGGVSGEAWVISDDGSSLAEGYYLVGDAFKQTAGANVTAVAEPMVLGVGSEGAVIKAKADLPTLTKRVIAANGKAVDGEGVQFDSVSPGDTIRFQLTGTLPDNVWSYNDRLAGANGYPITFTDTLGSALTLNASSVAIYLGTKSATPTSGAVRVYVDSGDPKVVTADGQTLTVAIPDVFKLYEADESGATKKTPETPLAIGDVAAGADHKSVLYVTYEASVNDKAPAAAGGTANEELGNAASLTYPNDPNGDTTTKTESTPDKVQLYTYGLDVKKVGDDGHTPLAGAGFTLYQAEGDELTKDAPTTANVALFKRIGDGANATFDFVGWHQPVAAREGGPLAEKLDSGYQPTEASDDATLYQICRVSDGDSQATLHWRGLDEGAYTLYETVTPTGYDTMNPYTWKFDAAESAGTSTLTLSALAEDSVPGAGVTAAQPDNGVATLTVRNAAGLLLPLTGGAGITTVALGVLCVIVATIALTRMGRRRRDR